MFWALQYTRSCGPNRIGFTGSRSQHVSLETFAAQRGEGRGKWGSGKWGAEFVRGVRVDLSPAPSYKYSNVGKTVASAGDSLALTL
jgi:hypothetical protein